MFLPLLVHGHLCENIQSIPAIQELKLTIQSAQTITRYERQQL